MNSSDPDAEDAALLRRLQSLPRPALRDDARQRSLATALAAAGSSAPTRRRLLRMSRLHLTGLAACWALAGYFHLSAPGAPENPGTSPAGGYTAWPGPFHPAPDAETAELLAALYPRRASTPP